MEGMVVTQWHNSPDDVITPFGPMPVPYVVFDRIFGGSFQYGHRWINIGVIIAFSCLTMVGVWAGMRFLRTVQR